VLHVSAETAQAHFSGEGTNEFPANEETNEFERIIDIPQTKL